MYPVSLEYQDKIKENNRIFKINIVINHSQGTLTLSDKDLALGSLSYSEGSQAGEDFTIGGTVASDLSFNIMNKPEYDNINFMGARVTVTISLLIREGADAHFLQPSQPSKMLASDDLWEDVPLGRFNIDDVKRLRNTIELKAIDDMINLDIPYSLSKLSYPANLYQIYVNICNVADVQIGTVNFSNKNYVVTNRPDGDLTLRDVLGYVAELSGTFAKFNRLGQLELKWYTPTNIEIGPQNRFNFKPSDDVVRIKGIMATVGDTTFLAGTDEYAIDLTENPLLQSNHEAVLPNIFNNVKDTVFTPYISDWQGNMVIQAGDMITQIDRDGKVYNTLITRSMYKYRGRSILEAKGLPEISKGYKGSTNRKIAQIRRVIEREVGDKLTTLEQAQLNSTELLANMLGGYIIEDKPNGIFYIADNPNIDLAMKVWKYGINGFGYSSTGKNGPYTTAVTADGSIVAMLVSANIITANMIQTGILQSEDGSSWFNLDNGEINIKEQLKFVDGKLTLAGVDAGNKIFNVTPIGPYKVNDLWKVNDIAGVDFKICIQSRQTVSHVASDWINVTNNKDYADLIKNLTSGTAIKGGTTTIDNTKVRVNHGSSGEYTELNYQGVKRQWLFGESEYLTDIWIYQGIYSGWQPTSPQMIRIDLPARFRGRAGKLKFLIIPTQLNYDGLGRYQEYLRTIATIMKVENIVVNNNEAYVWISAFIMTNHGSDTGGEKIYYKGLNFDLMVVGN